MKTKTYHSELKTALEADLHFDTTVMVGALAEWDSLLSQRADLLEALALCCEQLDKETMGGEALDKARAAIAKAKGQP